MRLGEWAVGTTKLKGEVEKRKGLVSFVSRGGGPLRAWSGQLSMSGKCQGVERQDFSRVVCLPTPRTEMCANSHPVCGEREEGILRRGRVFSKLTLLSLSRGIRETQLRDLS